MKKHFILLLFSALLFASSSLLSQTAEQTISENSTSETGDFSDNQISLHRFDVIAQQTEIDDTFTLNTMVLAKVSIAPNNTADNKKYKPADKQIDQATEQTIDQINLFDSNNFLNRPTSVHRFDAIIQQTNTDAIEKISEVETENTQHFSDEELVHLRQLFLQAEKAIKTKKDTQYFLLADQLKEYPLYPYLQYQWLKKHIGLERQIKHFIREHKTSRYAQKLKRQWLYHLAKRKQWPLFLEFYSASKETKLKCYYHYAQFNTGKKQLALEGAKKLWAVGRSQPRECTPLFSQLKKSGLLTQDLKWQRFNAALRNNKVSLAAYVRNLMPQDQHATAQLWLNLHRNPSRHIQKFLKQPETTQSALMFRHAIYRLASKDITKAVEIWDTNKQHFVPEKLTEKAAADKLAIDKLERRLALKLVFKGESSAYERLAQLDEHNNSSRTWRVRIALTEQNWPNVLTAIYALNDDEKADERWQYWLARAYMETGNIKLAQAVFTELSDKRSFYGFLAANKINSMYQLSNQPENVTTEEITKIKNRKEFRVAFELMKLDRKNNAKIQWWHAAKQLNKKEIIIASKLAQQWQWDEIAIFTVAKAKSWNDIEMRFPLSYVDKVLKNSALQKLDPSLLFGLIRRESAFNEKAYSPVGARGLMQIMPGTGRQIARHFNERWRGGNSLYNPATNLKYGSYYYQKLLNQFDGHYALALAAYNAGPHRVKKWLPETEALPADIWIETIPFHETREYVTTVLTYALIYQRRTQSDQLSMNDFTHDVQPLATTP